jgi:hypothetical protein
LGSTVYIGATEKLYLDGGSDTYLVESSANTLGLYTGGTLKMNIDSTKCYVQNTAFSIAPTRQIYLDGGDDTYLLENAANNVQLFVGGSAVLDIDTTALIVQNTNLQIPTSRHIYYAGSSADAAIGDTSGGTGSTTLYIGNAAIQVASDIRIKDNIKDTKINALDTINKLKVKDFTWNDPSDICENNRNARGIWTGLIAQEAVDVLPFAVNAPRIHGKEIDYDSDIKWQIEYANMVPVLIKAIQEQNELLNKAYDRIYILEKRVMELRIKK